MVGKLTGGQGGVRVFRCAVVKKMPDMMVIFPIIQSCFICIAPNHKFKTQQSSGEETSSSRTRLNLILSMML